ncbi:hypothetical protein D9M71_705050 [compost metagenome]
MQGDSAPHQLHQLPTDTQAQARTAVLRGRLCAGLDKRCEQLGLLLRADADTAVAHAQAHADALWQQRAGSRDLQDDVSFMGKLQCVAQHIDQHLAQAQRIEPIRPLGVIRHL